MNTLSPRLQGLVSKFTEEPKVESTEEAYSIRWKSTELTVFKDRSCRFRYEFIFHEENVQWFFQLESVQECWEELKFCVPNSSIGDVVCDRTQYQNQISQALRLFLSKFADPCGLDEQILLDERFVQYQFYLCLKQLFPVSGWQLEAREDVCFVSIVLLTLKVLNLWKAVKGKKLAYDFSMGTGWGVAIELKKPTAPENDLKRDIFRLAHSVWVSTLPCSPIKGFLGFYYCLPKGFRDCFFMIFGTSSQITLPGSLTSELAELEPWEEKEVPITPAEVLNWFPKFKMHTVYALHCFPSSIWLRKVADEKCHGYQGLLLRVIFREGVYSFRR